MKAFLRTFISGLAATLLLVGALPVPAFATLNGPREHRAQWHGASTNWSGYAAETSLTSPQNGAVTSVSGTWVVPTLTCGTQNTYSSAWVGIDGYSSNSVEQLGTEQDCTRRKPVYSAWYEMYPQWSHSVAMTIHAGDVMTASVNYLGNNQFKLAMTDTTTGQSFSTTQLLAGAARSSAEWVMEAPSSWFGVLPLSHFGNINFTQSSATFNGQAGTVNTPSRQSDPITMVNRFGQAIATPSALSADGASFNVHQ